MAEGLTNQQIGEQVSNTRYTVMNYLRDIYDKTGFDTRLELALWYVKYSEDLKQ